MGPLNLFGGLNRLSLGLLLVLLAQLSSCGWHAGLLAPPGMPDNTSVGVEIFGNTTPEPGLEADFSRHISGALVDFVALPYAAPDAADLVVRGELKNYRRRNGIRSDDNELLEGSVRIDVQAHLVVRQTGQVLASASQGLWADWALGTPELTAPGSGEYQARERVLQNLADRLVLDLFTNPVDREPVESE